MVVGVLEDIVVILTAVHVHSVLDAEPWHAFAFKACDSVKHIHEVEPAIVARLQDDVTLLEVNAAVLDIDEVASVSLNAAVDHAVWLDAEPIYMRAVGVLVVADLRLHDEHVLVETYMLCDDVHLYSSASDETNRQTLLC